MLPHWLVILLSIVGGFIVLMLLIKAVFTCCIYRKNKYSLDLHGRVVLVTGGTSGIGLVTVEELLFRGATVVFTGRNEKAVREEILPSLKGKLKAVAASNKTSGYLSLEKDEPRTLCNSLETGVWDEKGNFSSSNLYFRKVDQSNLNDMKTLAEWTSNQFESIAQIICNAGQTNLTYKKSVQGLEFTIVVNHLSHMYLIDMLLDKLGDEGRIINVSSNAHYQYDNSPKKIEHWNQYFAPKPEEYSFFKAYGHSKLGNVLFTKALNQLFQSKGKNAKSASLHPGVVRTNIFLRPGCSAKTLYTVFFPIIWATFMEVEQGAQTTLHCANVPFGELESGGYYTNCSIKTPSKAVTQENILAFMRESSKVLETVTGEKLKHFSS